MSQSPDRFETISADHEYLTNFSKLGKMIGQGKSFSGRERNCLYLNTGKGRFADISSVAGFDLIDDGRAMAITDWDADGDLDLWLTNRTGPRVRFLRNQHANNHQSLSILLRGTRCNRDAIGARVELYLTGDQPRTLIKTVRAGSGFLSQSSKRVHFGFCSDEKIENLIVRWPGQLKPETISLNSVEPSNRHHRRIEVTQSRVLNFANNEQIRSIVSVQHDVRPTTPLDGDAAHVSSPPVDQVRLFLTRRLQLPEISFFGMQPNETASTNYRALPSNVRLVMLWANWCVPCLKELKDLQAQADELSKHGIDILALSVDAMEDASDGPGQARGFLQQIKWSFRSGFVDKDTVRAITKLSHQAVYHERPLQIPFSFLVDSRGNVVAFYRGNVDVKQLIDDVRTIEFTGAKLAQVAFPFAGKTIASKFVTNNVAAIAALAESGDTELARSEIAKRMNTVKQQPSQSKSQRRQRVQDLIRLHLRSATLERQAGRFAAARRALQAVMQFSPGYPPAVIELAKTLHHQGDLDASAKIIVQLATKRADNPQVQSLVAETFALWKQPGRALEYFEKAAKIDPSNSQLVFSLAVAQQSVGDLKQASVNYRRLLQKTPNDANVINNLAWILAKQGADEEEKRESLRLAINACRQSHMQLPSFYDTLAVAYALNNDRVAAAAATRHAILLARSQGQNELVKQLESRLRTYEE